MKLDRQKPHSIGTGGAGRIGAATVKELASPGQQITRFDLAPHPDCHTNPDLVDVRDARAVEAAVQRATQQYGTVTGLVAYHGIRGAFIPALGLDSEELRKHYDVHVGTFNMSRQIVALLHGTAASMVFVTSTTAYGRWARQSDYGPVKAVERQLMENLTIEWAPLNVRVDGIAPGHTMTPWFVI